jgi:hypothetical protein
MEVTTAGGVAALPALAPATVRSIVDRAVDRYIATRHAKVEAFVARTYGIRGALRLHRHAIGRDLLRAPANVALVLPHLVTRLGGAGLASFGATQSGRRLKELKLFLDTDVARELTFRLHDELLELPFRDGVRAADKDALAEEILADPQLATVIEGLGTLLQRASDPAVRRRLQTILDTYTGARSAAADLLNNALMAGTGMAVLHQLTPGTLTLGPALATLVAQQAAVASFPLGATLGGLWYGAFGIAPSVGLVVGMTGGLFLATAALAPFAGVVTDPVLRWTGVHRRRLHRMIDILGSQLKGDSATSFEVRDHYVARIFDLIDLLRSVSQTGR